MTYTNEERTNCNQAIDAIANFIEANKKELIKKNSKNAYLESHLHIKSLRTYLNTLTYTLDYPLINKNPTLAEQTALTAKVYQEGDRARFEIFEVLQQTRYKNKKIFFWMHNWHAMKYAPEIEAFGRDEKDASMPAGTISLGTRMAEKYGKDLVVIGNIVPKAVCKNLVCTPPPARSVEEIAEIARQERDTMVAHAEKLRTLGIEVPCVSIGSTPTINHIDHLRGVTEVRPGNYIFFDAFQATLGSCGFEDCALTVLAAVTHRDRARRKIVVDAGAIALSKDSGPVEFDADCGYGRVLDLEGRELGLRVELLSQEHGVFHAPNDEIFESLKVGSRVRILANHSCLSAAQHAHFNVLEQGRITDRWEIHRGW